jgi:hypothetical protein
VVRFGNFLVANSAQQEKASLFNTLIEVLCFRPIVAGARSYWRPRRGELATISVGILHLRPLSRHFGLQIHADLYRAYGLATTSFGRAAKLGAT